MAGYNGKHIKTISTATGKTNPYKHDVIVDPEGQWKYPGQVTKIPSGDITMKGVDYPVLGVDNLGNKKMMYPGADYSFPGQSVTEYPQMKKGGWLDTLDEGGPHVGTPPDHDDSITHDDGFRTWNLGKLEGQPETKDMKATIQKYRDNPNLKVPGGESYANFIDRITPAYNKTLATSPDKTLIVTHSEVVKGLGLPKLKPGEVHPVKVGDKTIYITRHGDTYQNNTTPGDALVRTKDAQLAPEGIKEAEKNAKVLADKGVSKIVSSPLPRAITTADIIHQGITQKKQGGWLDNYAGGGPTPEKAKAMLEDGTAHGHSLTQKQIDFFKTLIKDDDEDADVEDYKRGGPIHGIKYLRALTRDTTNRNIKTSLNFLMARNYELYGKAGKRFYDPRAKFETGGWLDKYK
jgi:broad specificity phosphatase PhoE